MSSWDILDSYFGHNLHWITSHHLESYDLFVKKYIPFTIKSMNPFIIVKNDDEGKMKHEISVYIGGIDGSEI